MENEHAHNPKKRKYSQRYQKRDNTEPRKTSAETKSTEPEMLRPGARSNFIRWWRELEALVGEKYGEIQTIFTATDLLTAYNEPTAPVPNNADLADDPHGYKKQTYIEKVKMHLKKVEELEVLKTKVYNCIKRHMSQESWEEVKQDTEWTTAAGSTVEQLREPYLLLKCIRKTHTGHRTGVATLDIESAQMQYQNIKQLSHQTLIQYKDYFTHKVNTLTALGLTTPTPALQAIKFIKGLDDARFSELKAHYYNHAKTGTGSYPDNLTDAYNVAANHFQRKAAKPTNHEVAYFTQQQKGTQGNREKQKKGPWCVVCKCNDHWTNRCQRVIELAKDVEDETDDRPSKIAATATTKLTKTKKYITVLHTDYSDKERYNNFEPSNTEFILDTAATAAIIKEKSLLRNLRKSEQIARIKGVNSQELTTEWIGDLPHFGQAWYQPKAVANLIPFGRVEKKFNMKYERNIRFFFTIESGEEISFYKIEEDREGNGLYVYNPESREYLAAVTTVEDNKLNYSKREIRDANVAREFMRRAGYPSIKDAIQMLETGTITDCPVTVQDLVRAQHIYGPDIAVLKGKTTKKKSQAIKFDYLPKPRGINAIQNLHADIMFIDGQPYLLTISQPLDMRMVVKISTRDKQEIGESLMKIINVYRSRGFTIDQVLCDNEKGVLASKNLLYAEGVTLNTASAGQHVPIVERAIRQIKERMRAILSILPFTLPSQLMSYLVDYVVMNINIFPKTTSLNKISPRELFTGRKLNYKRDMRISFGDYAQVSIPNITSNDVRQPRTEGAIALTSTGNLQGSVLFFMLSTQSIVSRENFTLLPMPKEVVDKMNELSIKNKRKNNDVIISYRNSEEEVLEDIYNLNDENITNNYIPPTREEVPIETQGLNLEPIQNYDDIEGVTQPTIDPIAEEEVTNVPEPEIHRMSLRPNPPQTRWYAMHVSIKQALEKYKKPALKAILKELKQMRDKGVFEPVFGNTLTNTQLKKIIKSFMFLKEKFKADGSFDKIKARLVSLGNMQWEFFMNPSSPTASLQAVLMIAAIAAKEERYVATMDVPGAYLNADMNHEVLMSLEPLLTSLLVTLEPQFEKYINENGTLIVKLKKALYGLVESAKLWYDEMSKILYQEGFNVNPTEKCIFNKQVGTTQCTICLYVDDLMITCADETMLQNVINSLEKRFKGAKAVKGDIHSYLGMMFDYSTKGEVKITMEGFIQDVLNQHIVKGKANTPALTNLFEVRESPLLNEEKRKEFHSITAKLLYLAKRVRPDILTTVSYLSTRVTKASEDDWKRLDRLLKYLNYDPTSGITLKPGDGDITIRAYADASYGIHEDGKSHSGLCIALGEGPVFVRSSKQRIVSKSSTEAELISLSDGCSQVIWSRDFLIGQGYDISAATIYQDNKSTIAMIENGKSTSDRTRHINVRYYFIKDRIDSGEIKLEYIPTEEMAADTLTKPLVGTKFKELKAKLLNWYI